MAKKSSKQNNPRRLLGFGRFFKVVLGVGVENSHEVAHNYVLICGFIIEYLIVREAVITKYDDPNLNFQLVVTYALSFGLLFLFVHQFLIFRNFALPQKIKRKRLDEELSQWTKAKQSTQEPTLEQIEAIEELSEAEPDIPIVPKKVGRLGRLLRWPWFRRRKILEIAIYVLFAVLTGEAGYFLTIMRVHDGATGSRAIPQFVEDHFGGGKSVVIKSGTDETRNREIVQEAERIASRQPQYPVEKAVSEDRLRWGVALESLFVSTAAVLCVLVLLWDAVVFFSRSERERYDRKLILSFVLNDLLSLLIWLCILPIATPLWSSWTAWAWRGLGICYVSYMVVNFLRIWRGFERLGAPEKFEEARLAEI